MTTREERLKNRVAVIEREIARREADPDFDDTSARQAAMAIRATNHVAAEDAEGEPSPRRQVKGHSADAVTARQAAWAAS